MNLPTRFQTKPCSMHS